MNRLDWKVFVKASSFFYEQWKDIYYIKYINTQRICSDEEDDVKTVHLQINTNVENTFKELSRIKSISPFIDC